MTYNEMKSPIVTYNVMKSVMISHATAICCGKLVTRDWMDLRYVAMHSLAPAGTSSCNIGIQYRAPP